MSFDLVFMKRSADDDWDAAIAEHEVLADQQRLPTDQERALWGRVIASIAPVIGVHEVHVGDRWLEIDAPDPIVQVTMYPGEISLSTPYWWEGDQADEVTDKLRRMVMAIEGATGLVAFDPQSGGVFLDVGAPHAAETMGRISGWLRDEAGSDARSTEPKRRWPWRRR